MSQEGDRTRSTEAVGSPVHVARDRMGIPHIVAESRRDAYVGLGFAMAEDRLWQMDWYRRSAHGRTAEILGWDYLGRDVEARHVGFTGLAEERLRSLPSSTTDILEAFSEGANLALGRQQAELPPEFGILGYTPEPWSPVDTVAVMLGFWWYLSGRLNWLAADDLILRTLPPALADAFLMPTGDVGSIIDPDAVVPKPGTSGTGDGSGSNNWVVSGRLTTSGLPLLASDPHVVYSVPSMWYEVQIECPEEKSAGACYVGVPGFLVGRSSALAWGFTNNINSLRDLYREHLDPADGNRYAESPANWRAFESRPEIIAVQGNEPQTVTVRSTVRGPIVNALIDERLRPDEPVSLVWTGTGPSDEIGTMLRYQVAGSIDEFIAALEGWGCPSLNFVFADGERIGYQCVGDLPVRGRRWLGVRDSFNEDDTWQAIRRTPSLPCVVEPTFGWIATANNRVTATDDEVNQSGYWPSSLRSERLRQLLEGGTPHDTGGMQRMQLDVRSLHGERVTPPLLEHLAGANLSAIAQHAAALLEGWDGEFSLESGGATVFQTFFLHWIGRVAAQRFPEHLRSVAGPQGIGFATRLLTDGDEYNWFHPDTVTSAVAEVFEVAVADLVGRLGENPGGWKWGNLLQIRLPHPLDGADDSGWSFRLDTEPLEGGWNTINNAMYDPGNPFNPFVATIGPSLRMIADLARPDVLMSALAGGSSGDPHTAHYRDGFDEWRRGGYHQLWLSRDDLADQVCGTVHLVPASHQEPPTD